MKTQEEYNEIFADCQRDLGFPESERSLGHVIMLNMYMMGIPEKMWPAVLRRVAMVQEEFSKRCPERYQGGRHDEDN